MDYRAVDPSYSDDADHTEAKEAATDFVNALRRVRVSFGGIGIDAPCDNCQHDEHRITPGWISLDQARKMTAAVNGALDELERYRKIVQTPSAL
ncbi:hypothetical protein [Streptomyces sp. NPDC088115]|uniref:hypothetical protein n=1 Tax=Streptomyces sp. NPDC088115 TaxID=3365824 RepID=UPI0038277BA0